MDTETTDMMFGILRSFFGGEVIENNDEVYTNSSDLSRIVEIAKKHDIASLLVMCLKQNNLFGQEHIHLEDEVFLAIYRSEQMNYEFCILCNILECAGIDFIPLKGAVMRQYYPESWMRTSCDIDILIREENVNYIVDKLISEKGYVFKGRGGHDVSLFSPAGVHIELHYNLLEVGIFENVHSILSNVWEMVVKRNDSNHWYEMTDEMFYFYHIAHMAKHFIYGGCGIRPFIDLWILDHMNGVDRAKRDELLKQGNLLKFAESARRLSNVWFGSEQHTETTKQMESFILSGGVYGSAENQVAVQQQKKGGKIKYAFSKIFIPYDVIKFHYPILEKHKWLTPIMEVRRWCKLIFCGHLKRTVNELRYSGNINDRQASAMRDFLKNIGL